MAGFGVRDDGDGISSSISVTTTPPQVPPKISYDKVEVYAISVATQTGIGSAG